MNKGIDKSAGLALLTGSVLMLTTMVLHPSGGNLQHLLRISRIVVISHSMALLAIPFLGFGFWGLTKRLGTHQFLPILSFAFMLTGLLAGFIAATINGLALPLFIQHYKDATAEEALSIRPILRSNLALNQAFDYVFLTAISVSIFCWSVAILTLRKLSRWMGYSGLLLSFSTIAMLLSGFVLISLHGFRLFIFSSIVWISLIGIALMRSQAVDNK